MRKYIIIVVMVLNTMPLIAQDAMNIFEASRTGDLERIIELSNTDKNLLDSADYKGFTPLILACYNNNIDIVSFLLEHEVSIDNGDNSGNTALMGVSFKGDLGIAKRLLKSGADPNLRNYNGATA